MIKMHRRTVGIVKKIQEKPLLEELLEKTIVLRIKNKQKYI